MNLVVVLGMHRSGTSVLTKCLTVLGVDLGGNLLDANEYNSKGYFENKLIVELNESILDTIGVRWDSLNWQHVLSTSESYRVKHEIREVLENQTSRGVLLGIKDPRITRLLSIWMEVFQETDLEVGYVLANRHPLEVADSLKKRDGIPIAQGAVLWILHQISALEVILRRGGLVVCYENILDKPIEEMQRIGRYLGRGMNLNGGKTSEFEFQFLDASLRHSKFNVEQLTESTAPLKLTKDLYLFLEELGRMPGIPQGNTITEGLKLIAEVKDLLSESVQWTSAIEELNAIITTEREEARSIQNALASDLARVESQLNWIEARRSYRAFQKITSLLRLRKGNH